MRGVCALRPGIPGVSDNIQVRSIVGRFLEHSRVCWFENSGRAAAVLSSADWMERNFFRRVEIAFPITQAKLRTRIRDDLELYLNDTGNAWLLQSDGSYVRATSEQRAHRAQVQLLENYAAAAAPGVNAQLHARLAQVLDLLVQVLRRQRVILEPAHREAQFQRAARADQLIGRQRPCAATAVQQHGEAQQRRSGTAASRSHGGIRSSMPVSASLRRCAPTRRASSSCSSRAKPGMSAFSSR